MSLRGRWACFAGPGVVQGELDGAVGEVASLDAGDLGARELGAAHHLDHPADLRAGDRGGEAVAGGARDELRRARRAVDRHDVHRALARYRDRHQAAACGLRRVHHDRRARRCVDLRRQRAAARRARAPHRCAVLPGSAPARLRRLRRGCTRTTSRARCRARGGATRHRAGCRGTARRGGTGRSAARRRVRRLVRHVPRPDARRRGSTRPP